ncbi:hypothetical protein RchiOBHm_Chr6g0266541 [Rosa chinensis]|uniref:Uncharacterized protein n=1 Tax=Rosa chinensis TaxID=74649 RepID=A0A2P6PPP7_ROSCH|nr:hypothetical protein RchiOBHm_Chr6g0266541 [Rosa chinensis]
MEENHKLCTPGGSPTGLLTVRGFHALLMLGIPKKPLRSIYVCCNHMQCTCFITGSKRSQSEVHQP